MPIDALYPFAGNHAVQTMAVALEFAGPQLAEDSISSLKKLHRSHLLELLPNELQPQVMTIALDGPSPSSSMTKASNAITFSKPSSIANLPFARQLHIQPDNRVSYQVFDYVRWSVAWEQIEKILTALGSVLFEQRSLAAIGLQYNDIFFWRDDPSRLKVDEVFSKNSPYLPPNIFDLQGAWHSHHGYFEQIGNESAQALLHNVNTGVQQVEGQIAVSISTSHRAAIEPTWSFDASLPVIKSLLPLMHEKNKDLLRSLLTSAVRRKINLQD